MTYCRRHGRRTDICGCSRSYPCLACGGLFPGADHICPGEAVRAAESRSDPLAGNAHVRAHHTPTWQPCGRGICAAEAGHEGTCEEASGFVDWTPEFYDDDDPDPSTEAWRELLATSREDV